MARPRDAKSPRGPVTLRPAGRSYGQPAGLPWSRTLVEPVSQLTLSRTWISGARNVVFEPAAKVTFGPIVIDRQASLRLVPTMAQPAQRV